MRSFILSIFATLALAAFSFAAPMPAAGLSPVNAVAARHDEHDKSNSLEAVLTNAITVITPITVKLGCIDSNDATLDVIAPIVADLKVAIEGVIADVQALASLPLERILCTIAGGVLDAVAIAKLLACLLNLIFGAFASLLVVVVASVQVQLIVFLADVGCLVGSLLCDVLGLVEGLASEIIKCILPQIIGCSGVIKLLNIQILITTIIGL